MEDSKDINARIDELRKIIRHHNQQYYLLDSPDITDAEYDFLMHELRKLEQQYPELITADSPTQRVGAPPSASFNIVEHQIPMLSLANAFDNNDLLTWYNRVLKLSGKTQPNMVCEHKIDGLAVSLIYEHGKFIRGATRGDGLHGENITHNLKTIRSLPLSIAEDIAPPVLEVRGEVFLPISAFHQINNDREHLGLPLFANPRNAAAGSVRQLDPKVTAQRPLDILIYQLGFYEGGNLPSSHWELLAYFNELGFKTNTNNRRVNTIKDVEIYHEKWLKERDTLSYEIDGIVAKLDSLDLQNELGDIGREPRWAIAYKFPPIQVSTRLLDIGISVGRTGTLNPYAILEPVNVGGVTIRQAALHNEEDIRRKDIRIGDSVIVQRAGDVIPEIVGPEKNKRTGTEKEFSIMDKLFDIGFDQSVCPVCHSEIFKPEGEVMYYCTNAACPAQAYQRLKHFASRDAMDIRGIGEAMAVMLTDNTLVLDVSDLYKLNKEHLLTIDRMGDKSADNILKSIETSKTRTLSRLIYALGIRHIGQENAELLAKEFNSIDYLISASYERLTQIPSIGPKIAESIINYFKHPENMRIIIELGKYGVRTTDLIQEQQLKPLSGKEFVITGTLSKFSRNQAEAKIKNLGGFASSNVSKKTDYLVFGNEPGSKLDRARELGITIIDEDEFIKLLGDTLT